jgi:hypothetical protein
MVVRVVVAAVLLLVAVAVAWQLNRRRPAPPTQDGYPLPRQLDRADFERPDAPWLVVLFSSATCDSCARMVDKVRVLDSGDVATCEVEYGAHPDLHERYSISGVPMVVIADADGVVRNGFVGPVGAGELWAAVSEARDPGANANVPH